MWDVNLTGWVWGIACWGLGKLWIVDELIEFEKWPVGDEDFREITGEIFEHYRYCFQVQLITCCDLSGFPSLYWGMFHGFLQRDGSYSWTPKPQPGNSSNSTGSSVRRGKFPVVFIFNQLFLKRTQPLHWWWAIFQKSSSSTSYFSNSTSSSTMGNFPELLNFNRLFLKLNHLVAMHDEWQFCLRASACWTKTLFCSWMQMQIQE